MERWMVSLLVIILTGATCATVGAEGQSQRPPDSSPPALDAPRSESQPGATAQSTMKRDPHSGTMVPESSPSVEGQREDPAHEPSAGRSRMRDMAQVPAGIGERGTGQTQSTLERSGGAPTGR